MVTLVVGTNRQCGVSVFTHRLASAMERLGEPVQVIHTPEAVSQASSPQRFYRWGRRLSGAGPVIIQHEFSLWGSGFRASLANLLGFVAGIPQSRPIWIQYHTVVPDYFVLERPANWWVALKWRAGHVLYRCLYQRVSGIVVHETRSASILQASFRSVGVKPGPRLAILPLPAPPPYCTAPRSLRGPSLTLVLLGFLAVHKGHQFLLSVLPGLPASYRLLFAGGPHPEDPNGPRYQLDLYRQILLAGLQDRVEITGWIDEADLGSILQRADIGILPYDAEALSASAAVWDLLAAGLPVIASDIDAFTELAMQTPAVQIFRRRDPTDFFRALRTTILRYDYLSLQALELVQQRNMDTWAQCLQGLLSGKSVCHW